MLTASLLASIMLVPAHHPPASVDDVKASMEDASLFADHAAATPADLLRSDAPEQGLGVTPVADGELGWVDTYWPFLLDKNLHPEVEKNLVPIWLLSIFLGGFIGPLWIPKLITDLNPDESYQNEALLVWLFHVVVYVLYFTVVFAYIPIIGWAVAIAAYAFMIANAVYFFPVATINSFNRHVGGGGGGGGGGSPRKRRKKAPVQKKKAAQRFVPGAPTTAMNGPSVGLAY